jgi:hypothetical protein
VRNYFGYEKKNFLQLRKLSKSSRSSFWYCTNLKLSEIKRVKCWIVACLDQAAGKGVTQFMYESTGHSINLHRGYRDGVSSCTAATDGCERSRLRLASVLPEKSAGAHCGP